MRVSFLLITALTLIYPLSGKSQEDTAKNANAFAARTGSIAGTATFCQLEADLIEQYIDRAQALIAAQTKDDVDLVVARIGFTSSFNVSSSKKPAGGCEQFAKEFPTMVKTLDE